MEHNLGNTPVQEERPKRMLIRRRVGPLTGARMPTGLQHLATSKWGALREAIRRTDRPQKHSIADERALAG
jgi:hypothetical protein